MAPRAVYGQLERDPRRLACKLNIMITVAGQKGRMAALAI